MQVLTLEQLDDRTGAGLLQVLCDAALARQWAGLRRLEVVWGVEDGRRRAEVERVCRLRGCELKKNWGVKQCEGRR